MRNAVLLTLSLLLAGTVAIAQNSSTAGSQENPSQNPSTTTTHTQTTQGTMLRGCLSGSSDNYTLTDLNGTQYKLMGGDTSLQSAVGHEVEVSGTQTQAAETASGSGETMAHAANNFQVTQVRDTGSTCKMGSHVNSANPSDHPMDEKPPKGTATTTDQPQPQMMAMLQQSGSAPMSTTGTDASQTAQTGGQSAGAQTTPPVTSQTPATSPSPTSPDAQTQTGGSPASTTGTSPAEGNSNAQAARQGETSTNPNTGQTNGQGVSGSPAPSTDPNAVPASPNSTAPQSTGTTPQTNSAQPQSTDDSNKPLYERQATDVPYAHHGDTTATPNSTSNPTTPH